MNCTIASVGVLPQIDRAVPFHAEVAVLEGVWVAELHRCRRWLPNSDARRCAKQVWRVRGTHGQRRRAINCRVATFICPMDTTGHVGNWPG